jgi:hypothetical protein
MHPVLSQHAAIVIRRPPSRRVTPSISTPAHTIATPAIDDTIKSSSHRLARRVIVINIHLDAPNMSSRDTELPRDTTHDDGAST